MIVTILQNRGSAGAKRLAEALQAALPSIRVGRGTASSVKRCRGSRYIINWGSSQLPVNWRQRNSALSNSPEGVANCQDKIKTLWKCKLAEPYGSVPCLEFHDSTLAGGNPAGPVVRVGPWLEQDGKIVARLTTTGHSGAGIVIARRGQALPAASLYTRYFKKDAEYRVHVAFGNVILIQQKRKRNNAEQTPEQALIRTHANGWVFTTNNRTCDERGYTAAISSLALDAARACGVSHCAVDILTKHTAEGQNSVVCELNSAPGIEAGSTLEAYTTAFANRIKALA